MNYPCAACLRAAQVDPEHKVRQGTQEHHKFHNTKANRELYPEYINDPRNKERACPDCNASHRSVYLTHWSELDFCEEMKIVPRSQEGLLIWNRLENKWRVDEAK